MLGNWICCRLFLSSITGTIWMTSLPLIDQRGLHCLDPSGSQLVCWGTWSCWCTWSLCRCSVGKYSGQEANTQKQHLVSGKSHLRCPVSFFPCFFCMYDFPLPGPLVGSVGMSMSLYVCLYICPPLRKPRTIKKNKENQEFFWNANKNQEKLRKTTYYLPLTTYHLPLTTYHLPLTTYNLQLTTYHLPLTTYHLPLTTWHFTLYI